MTQHHPGTGAPLTREEAEQARLEALTELGLSEPWPLGGLFAPEAAYCLTCGATILIVPGPDERNPNVGSPPLLHYRSHNPTPTEPPTQEDPHG